MIKRFIIAGVICVIIVGLGGTTFYSGFRLGQQYPKSVTITGVDNIEGGKKNNVDFGTFWQTWQLIDEKHVKAKDIASQERVYGAIRGLVSSLKDPYSDFFNPVDNKKFQEDIQGNFSGIGAEIGFRKEQLVVISPLPDSPAMRSGLKAGDAILKVDGTLTDGLTVDRAVSLIRGQKNSAVTLLIIREGWKEPKEFKITREEIMLPTLEWSMKDDGIAYIKLYSFNANVNSLFYRAVTELLDKKAKGIVLDLRNNPGGYLQTAVDLGGWFLPKGALVVSEVGREGVREELHANGNSALVNFPIVVLVNEASASASEILAGALRDDRKIKLVGVKSFGKGTVQELVPLVDGSSVKLTIAKWVLPSGHALDGEGLPPDIEVKNTAEDAEKDRDPQLDKAIEVLKKELGG